MPVERVGDQGVWTAAGSCALGFSFYLSNLVMH